MIFWRNLKKNNCSGWKLPKVPEAHGRPKHNIKISMKRVFLISAITLMSLSSLSIYAKRWYYNCEGGGRVYFTTSDDTTPRQAGAMGRAWCDNRE